MKYKCEVVTSFDEIPQVRCNAGQIGQVVLNLVVNASHAIAERGVVSISTSFQNDTVTIVVEDSGSGIEAHHLDKLFDPFFTTKPVGQGTGLGLAIVYGIVTDHGGDINVDSELGRGTKFTITLPVDKADPVLDAA